MIHILHQEFFVMKALTIRDIPKDVEKVIKKRAMQKNISLNKVVLDLLEEATGKKTKKKIIYHDLDNLFGSWEDEESQEFDRNLSKQRLIDKELWE